MWLVHLLHLLHMHHISQAVAYLRSFAPSETPVQHQLQVLIHHGHIARAVVLAHHWLALLRAGYGL